MGSEPTTSGQGGNTNGHEELAPSFYYHSSPDPLPYGWEPYGVYTRVDDEEVLGTSSLISPSGVKEGLEDRSHCFNCGESDHKVTECRFRLNRDLVALARQYYQFYQKGPVGGWKRIHSVEEWRQKRLDWLEEFEPGKIKGELLKEALSAEHANEDEWMRNISVWGYPRGWVSERDPLELVRARIWSENEGDIEDHNDDDTSFEIYGDKNDVETVSFKDAFPLVLSAQNTRTPSTNGSYSDCQPANPSSRSISVAVDPIRWAHYPPSYFSSQHLILYNPPIPSESWSSTVFENTDAYLHQFYRQPNAPPPPPNEPPPPLPPSHPPPPLPPSSTPLPLPPPPAHLYLPSLPSPLASEYRKSINSLNTAKNLDPSDDLSEANMDFSDSD